MDLGGFRCVRYERMSLEFFEISVVTCLYGRDAIFLVLAGRLKSNLIAGGLYFAKAFQRIDSLACGADLGGTGNRYSYTQMRRQRNPVKLGAIESRVFYGPKFIGSS